MARRALEKAQRADGWFNTISGVGVSNSRAAMSFAVGENEYLDLATIDTLYNFDGIAARVCDSVPDHALRQGFTVSTGVSEVETAIRVALDKLKALPTLKRAWTWGRLFGGGAVLLGCDDGADLRDPIDIGSLRAVRWLYDVDRRDLFPLTWGTDKNAQSFGHPVLYTLNRMGGTATQTVTVHESRLLRFEGPTPSRRRRLQLQGWGDSVLQRCFAEIQATRAAFAASGDLVQQASQGVLKIKGLMDMMSSDTDDLVKRRLYLMDVSRSVARSMLIDADGEDFVRLDAGSLTGVADIMDRNINLLAAVSRIPVTVLMGQAPAGLNATGDSDIRNWYDALQAEREAVLREPLTKLVQLVLRSSEGPTRGIEPEGWRVVLPSLWQATPVEQAELELKVAQRDQVYITAQVLTPEEVAVSRFRKEGWSSDTSIDLDTREAIIDADTSGAPDTTVDPGSADAVAAIVARVAGREIPRDSGVALLVHTMGLTPEAADAMMGESGRSFWTKPDPAATTELDSLRTEHQQLQASARGTQQMLARVLERNRAGELVIGSPVASKPTEVKPGEALEEGDVVEVPVDDAHKPPVDPTP